MNRAPASNLRIALEVASQYTQAGIMFVCVPVDTDEQHAEAANLAASNLNKMIKDAESEE